MQQIFAYWFLYPGTLLNSSISVLTVFWWSLIYIPFFQSQSFPALGSFLMSRLFASGGQSIAVSTVSTAGAIRLSFLISCVKVLQPGVIICLSLTPLLLVGGTLPGCNILF